MRTRAPVPSPLPRKVPADPPVTPERLDHAICFLAWFIVEFKTPEYLPLLRRLERERAAMVADPLDEARAVLEKYRINQQFLGGIAAIPSRQQQAAKEENA